MRLLLLLALSATVLPGQEAAVGRRAPGVVLDDQDGAPRRLPLRGSWTILAFYVRAGSAQCAREVSKLDAVAKRLAGRGARLFGISTDTVSAQKAFHQDLGPSFPLLSDPTGAAAKRYGGVFGRRPFARRRTWLIDPEGVVRAVVRDVRVATHGEDVVALLDRLAPPSPASTATETRPARDPDTLVVRLVRDPPPGVDWREDRPAILFEGRQPASLRELRKWLREAADPLRFPELVHPETGEPMMPMARVGGRWFYPSRKHLVIITEATSFRRVQEIMQLSTFFPGKDLADGLLESPFIYKFQVIVKEPQGPDPELETREHDEPRPVAAELVLRVAPADREKPPAERPVEILAKGAEQPLGTLTGTRWDPPGLPGGLLFWLAWTRPLEPRGAVLVTFPESVPLSATAVLAKVFGMAGGSCSFRQAPPAAGAGGEDR